MAERRTVISLCDKTGAMVRPWAEAGYSCLCLDIQHSIRKEKIVDGIVFRWADVRALTPADLPDPLIIFAFPPCTHLAGSGARDWRPKGLRLLIDALEVVDACWRLCRWYGVPWMLENSVGRLSQVLGPPRDTFQPWQFGDNEQKRTCLWHGSGFIMPAPSVLSRPDDVRQACFSMPPSSHRADDRSRTPLGFARAVAASNMLFGVTDG